MKDKVIKSSFKSGDKEFVTYANEWDLYNGEISWDDITITQQNRIINAMTSDYENSSESISDIIMEIGVRKKPTEGLSALLLAISFLFEHARLIQNATEWNDAQKAIIEKFLNGTMLGRRLEKLFSGEDVQDISDCAIYEAELERLSGDYMYNEMLDLKHDEFKSFSQQVLSLLPGDTNIDGEKAAVLRFLTSKKLSTSDDIASFEDEIKNYSAKNAIGNLKKQGLINYVSTETEPFYDTESSNDDALYSDYVVWLTEAGKTLAKTTIEEASIFIDEKNEKNKSIQKIKAKNVTESEIEKKKLVEQIDNQGGWVFEGLYHLNRRVKAKIVDDRYWLLSKDEEDLTTAIGLDKIPKDMNRVDLNNQFGLTIKNELAPVDINISEWGSISIDRNDEWGQGAKHYDDNRSTLEKIGIKDWKGALLFLVLFPVFIADVISDRLSSKANSFLCLIFVAASMSVPILHGDSGLNSLEDWFHLFLTIYLLLPLIVIWPKSSFKGKLY